MVREALGKVTAESLTALQAMPFVSEEYSQEGIALHVQQRGREVTEHAE